MTTAAVRAIGTLLKRGDGGGPENFTTVAEVTNITGPGLSQAMIDTTSHESPNWREFITGLADGGQVSFDINYIPDNASHNVIAGLLKDFKDQADGTLLTPRNYQIVFPDVSNTVWTFAAWISDFEPTAPATGDDKLSASVTMKVTGEPTLA